jgi:hypothetical protein
MMRQERVRKLIRRAIVLCVLLPMVFTIFAFTGIRSASAATTPAACQHVLNVDYSVSCKAPTVTNYCSGAPYKTTTDSYGIVVDYRLTNASQECIKVTYNFSPAFSSCDIDFYIPAGSIATASFKYVWYDSAGRHVGNIDEDTSLAGWNYLFSSSSATSMYFNDNDIPGGVPLSWGDAPAHSLEVVCS